VSVERGRPIVEHPSWWEAVMTIAPAAFLVLVLLLAVNVSRRR
jgi:hypothetical protein